MLEEIMLQQKVWAVLGANQNPEKYGNIIYRRLKEKKYTVYPVSPIYSDVDGDEAYKDLASLPEKPDVVNFVVSPKRGMAYLEEVANLGIRYIWLQPGTVDDALLIRAKELKLEVVEGCVLVATSLYASETVHEKAEDDEEENHS